MMSNPYRINLRQSQMSQNIKRQPLRNSQINFLNSNQMARSLVRSNEQNSQRTSHRKIHYKYQRVNNSFRLVEVDPIQSENKQNQTQYSKESIEERNNHFLTLINSLTERIDRIQKNQRFEQQKQQFHFHQTIESLVNQKNKANLAYLTECKAKIEQLSEQMNQNREKMKTFQILPGYIADSEIHIYKKCKQIIQEHIGIEKAQRNKYITEQIQKLNRTKNDNLNVIPRFKQSDAKENEHLRSQIKGMVEKMNETLQNYVESEVLSWQNQKSAIFLELSAIRQAKSLFQRQLQILTKNIIEIREAAATKPEQQLKKCQKKIIANVVLKLKVKPLQIILPNQNKAVSSQSQSHILEHVTVYGLDSQGYLLDSKGFYLLDTKNQHIRLTKEHIAALEKAGLTITTAGLEK